MIIIKVESKIFYEDDNPYMELKYYDFETADDKVYNVTIYKICLGKLNLKFSEYDTKYPKYENNHFAGYESHIVPQQKQIIFDLNAIENDSVYIIKDVTPPKEMTLKDIENKLGYKVKIVSQNNEG